MRCLPGSLLLVVACAGPAAPRTAPPGPSPPAPGVAAAAVEPAPPPPDPGPLHAAAEAATPGTARAHDAWRAAAEAYDAVATHPDTPKVARLAAMRGAVDCWTRWIDGDVRVASGDQAADAATALRIAASFERYGAALGPEAAERPFLIWIAAAAYHRASDLDHAIPLCAALVRQHPDDPHAEQAAWLLLDVLNRAGRHDELIGWVEEMRTMPRLLKGRAELGELLARLHLQGLRKRAERQEKAGDHAGCASTYRLIHTEAPRDEHDDEVLYNALVCLDRAGDSVQLAASLAELENQHPKSDLTARARARWKKK